MIDLHCHILPAVDDGCQDIDSSLTLLKKAEAAGITDVILTPHYIKRSQYCADNSKKRKLLTILEQGKRRAGINVNLYLGNEVYVDYELIDLIRNNEVSTLAGSRYILIELPVRVEDMSALTTCFELISMGYVPVIAHPERYEYFQDDFYKMDEFLQVGCLMQLDYASLLGRYGKRAQKIAKQMLFNNKIQLIGSDVHHASEDYAVPEMYKKLKAILKDEHKVFDLIENNPRAILNDQEILR